MIFEITAAIVIALLTFIVIRFASGSTHVGDSHSAESLSASNSSARKSSKKGATKSEPSKPLTKKELKAQQAERKAQEEAERLATLEGSARPDMDVDFTEDDMARTASSGSMLSGGGKKKKSSGFSSSEFHDSADDEQSGEFSKKREHRGKLSKKERDQPPPPGFQKVHYGPKDAAHGVHGGAGNGSKWDPTQEWTGISCYADQWGKKKKPIGEQTAPVLHSGVSHVTEPLVPVPPIAKKKKLEKRPYPGVQQSSGNDAANEASSEEEEAAVAGRAEFSCQTEDEQVHPAAERTAKPKPVP